MVEKLLEFKSLEEGKLIKRYKRFLADIELNDGRKITAHCPNTGPMKGLLSNDARVRVRFSPSPKRKLEWTWEQVQVFSETLNKEIWVGINTLLANKLIRKVIERDLLKDFIGDIDAIKTEMIYGESKKSKIDFFLTPTSLNPDNRKIYIEVKNTTWIKNDIALFPDTVTTRGQKHLKELMAIIPSSRGVLIPCITRTDVNFFTSGDEADTLYGNLFRQSIQCGLEIIPCIFDFQKDSVNWGGFIPLVK